MTAARRRRLLVVVLSIIVAWSCRQAAGRGSSASPPRTLVGSIRSEPRSFNRYVARDITTEEITFLTQAPLVRVDRVTQRLQAELAESWELLPDGVTYRVKLRRDVRFSDGQPFSADDVAFAFRAIYDTRVGSPLADTLRVHGQPLSVTAEGKNTVTIRFPSSFSPGLRMLDGVPILPRHRLESSLIEGRFAHTWGSATNPGDLAGLGPFMLSRYDAGQRLVFVRNPHYWKRDGNQPLPLLDRVVLEIVPDQDAELLRLQTGAIDFTESELRPSDYGALKQLDWSTSRTGVALTDLGIGQDGDWLWFNLTPPTARDGRGAWLRHADFRRAISHAIDRNEFVNTVFLGAAVPAYGVVSPGNKDWYTETPHFAYDVAEANRLLASLGLSARGPDGIRLDAGGTPVRFTILTQEGNTALERGATVIRDDLQKVGIRADIVEFEVGALIQRFMSGDYDALYFRLLTTDTDPALNPDFWFSSGSAHVWSPSQPSAATPWERQMDQLMDAVSTEPDQPTRHALFAKVQRILAQEVPVLCFAYPRVWVGLNNRVVRSTLAPSRPPLLWNPAVIEIRSTTP